MGSLLAVTAAMMACDSPPAAAPSPASPGWTLEQAGESEALFTADEHVKKGRGRRSPRASSVAAQRARKTSFEMAADLSSKEALLAWVGEAKPAFLEALGAERKQAPLNLSVAERHRSSGVERIRIGYDLADGFRIAAYVYRPEGLSERAPAILLFHGHHNDGKDSAAVSGPTFGYGQFSGALDLARAGYVVMTPDIRSFGESGDRRHHELYVKIGLLQGYVALGAYVEDGWRALDVLEKIRFVDPDRLAVAGLSLGAQLSIYMAATDPRLKAAVVQGYVGSHHGTHVNRRHCVCQYMPDMGRLMDISDAATLALPRPMLFVSGKRDREFPPAEARRAFERIRKAYALVSAEAGLEWHEHPKGHLWLSEPAIAFLKTHL